MKTVISPVKITIVSKIIWNNETQLSTCLLAIQLLFYLIVKNRSETTLNLVNRTEAQHGIKIKVLYSNSFSFFKIEMCIQVFQGFSEKTIGSLQNVGHLTRLIQFGLRTWSRIRRDSKKVWSGFFAEVALKQSVF